MKSPVDAPSRLAPLLWTLLVLFILRVTGQALVAFLHVDFLPPMEEWYSGLLTYEYLLPSQIVIIVLTAKICLDFTKGSGFFVKPRRFFAVYWYSFGYIYVAGMVGRYIIRMHLHPEARWFGGTIPIIFHEIMPGCPTACGGEEWHPC